MGFKGIAAAVGLTFLTAACSTTPRAENEVQSNVPTHTNGLLGEINPETGCFEKKKVDSNGAEKVTSITCPLIK